MKSRERIDKTSIQIDTVQILIAIFAKRKEFSSKLCRVYSNTYYSPYSDKTRFYLRYLQRHTYRPCGAIVTSFTSANCIPSNLFEIAIKKVKLWHKRKRAYLFYSWYKLL